MYLEVVCNAKEFIHRVLRLEPLRDGLSEVIQDAFEIQGLQIMFTNLLQKFSSCVPIHNI